MVVEPSEHEPLWRYVDFSKFIAILETRSLHFAALRTFVDPFEGHPPRSAISEFRGTPAGLSAEDAARYQELVKNNVVSFQQSRNYCYASCWHANAVESAAMWNVYLQAGEGIAIRTSLANMKAALGETDDPKLNVGGAMVMYVDYETFRTPVNVFLWAALKRLSFKHEREFRLILLGEFGDGLPVPVDVGRLIESIVVSPTMPEWMLSLVKSVVVRYGLSCPLTRSTLLIAPDYSGYD